MRQLPLLLLIFFLMICCQKKKEPDYVIVTGQILHTGSDSVYVYDMDAKYKKTVYISPEGKFRDTLATIPGGHYYLVDGNVNVEFYAAPGDQVNVSYDTKDLINTVKFTGNEGAVALNNYRYKAISVWKEVTDDNMEAFYFSPKDSFLTKLHTVKKKQNRMLDTTPIADKVIKEREMRNNGYYYLGIIDSYEKINNITLTQQEKDSVMHLVYNNSIDFDYSRYYRYFVTQHYKELVNDIAAKENIKLTNAFYKVADTISLKSFKDYFLYNGTSSYLNQEKNIDSIYKAYMKASTDTLYRQKITEQYNNLHKVEDGNMSPLFTNYENYEGGTTSLADFRGKYVYIDVWATWCGPCIQEIPHLKKLAERYKNRNIVFMSISIDQWQKHKTWKKMVKDKELTGVQLFAKDGVNAPFIKTYQVNLIPRFILIGPDGKIIRSHAPAPSDGNLEKLLEVYKI